MNERDFCYWLNGFFDLNANKESLSPEQIACIREHLKSVFVQNIPSVEDKVKVDKNVTIVNYDVPNKDVKFCQKQYRPLLIC